MLKLFYPGLLLGYALGGPLIGMTLFWANFELIEAFLGSLPDVACFTVLALIGGGLCGLALLPSFFVGAVCGYFLPLGPAIGTALLAITVATTGGVLIGRRLSAGWISEIIGSRPKWNKMLDVFNQLPQGQVYFTLVCLRLAPQMPFALTNLLVSVWPLPWTKITSASIVGLMPRTLLALAFGASIEQLTAIAARGPTLWEWGLSGLVLLPLVLLMNRLKRMANRQLAME